MTAASPPLVHPDAPSRPVPANPAPVAAARVAAGLLVALAVTIPLATGRVLWSVPGAADDWNRRITVAPFDVVLLGLLAWAVLHREAVASLARSRPARLLVLLYVATFTLSFLASPSWLGVQQGLRLGAGVAVVAAAGAALAVRTSRHLVLAGVTAVGVAQAGLALVQSGSGRALGVAPLDFAGPLYPFGSSFAGRGGFTHPYHLAVMIVVAQGAALLGLRTAGRRWPWALALVALGTGLGVTYTRAGLVGQALLLGAALLAPRADRPRLWLGAGALAVGLLLGGTAFGDGWIARGNQSVAVEGADSGRGDRFAEAGRLVAADPLTGAGPGRYVEALADVDHTDLLPAHDVVLHQAAELGVLGGLATAALLALLAWRAVRAGSWAVAVAAPMLPFLLLDAYPYVFATGLALAALWLALVRHALHPVTDAG